MRNNALRVLFATCAAFAVLGTVYILAELLAGNPPETLAYFVTAAAWIALTLTVVIRFYLAKHGYLYSRTYEAWFGKKKK